jgi:GGDEF domain-containing protein
LRAAGPAGRDEKIRVAVAAITTPSIERAITASIGVAVLPEHAGDATSLLRHADRALYSAKKNGRNRTEVFALDMLPDGTTTVATPLPAVGPVR